MGSSQYWALVAGITALGIAAEPPTVRAQTAIRNPEVLVGASETGNENWESLDDLFILLCLVLDCDIDRPTAASESLTDSIDAAALQIAQTYETRGVRPNLTIDEKVIGHLTVSRILRILGANPDRMSRSIRDRFAADLVCLRAELEQ